MCYIIMCIPITIGLQLNPDHWSIAVYVYPYRNGISFPYFKTVNAIPKTGGIFFSRKRK